MPNIYNCLMKLEKKILLLQSFLLNNRKDITLSLHPPYV